jgi:hypothetical protein
MRPTKKLPDRKVNVAVKAFAWENHTICKEYLECALINLQCFCRKISQPAAKMGIKEFPGVLKTAKRGGMSGTIK